MNLEYFISKNIIKGDARSKKFTKPIIRISIAAIALGLTVMIVAISIVSGFQQEIRNKVIGFGSHIQITSYDSQNTYEASPISKSQDFYPSIDSVEGIKHIQVFANKAGIIKTNEEIYGVVVKGIGSDFDWDFFDKNLIEGELVRVKEGELKNDLLISKTIADKMKLKVGDKTFIYFIQQNGQLRPKDFIVKGIYKSGLEQFDNLYVLSDIAHVQKRNGWTENQVGGFEILINSYDDLDKLDLFVYDNIGYDLHSTTIVRQNPDIFNWLELQDVNVIVIIVLMVVVAAINIISALLILILERTNMIGILKALGMPNWNVRKIFMYNAVYLVVKGLIWGNVIGLGLCFLQMQFGFLTLPQESYYVSVVPVKLNFYNIFLLNIGTLLICAAMMIIPSYVITKITPIKAIRFD
ncbi:ABC transporter permease [Vicingus serpentipes]|uniref:ABC transporter permease n=1 Tax=Vicingus serpentipes TaxID=1926625 RepID=A0A5C6RZ18_9FLAO|nr:FtsX-like permease family protein [Vicingus serpentipes]TXB67307.1 ABC transporter permease [Vicingus serpentipes]